MKIFDYMIMLLCVLCCASCIEEYNELPKGVDEQMVVVDGQIVSERDCVFSLRWSAPLGDDYHSIISTISGATIAVVGSGGENYKGYEQKDAPGHYVVPVGKLNPANQYQLRFDIEGHMYNYVSQPMSPLDAPGIEEVCFEQPREDRQVDFMVTTSDPEGPAYFLWEYDECWEINTPYVAYWEYKLVQLSETNPLDVYCDGNLYRIDLDKMTNHGWCTTRGKDAVIATNENYGQGAIPKICIYQRNADDNRFQTRYLSRIHQMAITPQEYEYRHLLAVQSTEMGGLFTPMPSELPSNITAMGEGPRAIGFIGVRGKVSEAELYVKREELDHRDTYHVDIVPDSLVEEPAVMLRRGYRVISYNPYSGEVLWSNRWVIDCTDHFWGASLEKPVYWRDEEEE